MSDNGVNGETKKRKRRNKIKVVARHNDIVDAIILNPRKASAQAIYEQLNKDRGEYVFNPATGERDLFRIREGLKQRVSLRTISRDLADPELQERLNEILYEEVDNSVRRLAVANIVRSIGSGNIDDSKWLLERIDFFPEKIKKFEINRINSPVEKIKEEIAEALSDDDLDMLLYTSLDEPEPGDNGNGNGSS